MHRNRVVKLSTLIVFAAVSLSAGFSRGLAEGGRTVQNLTSRSPQNPCNPCAGKQGSGEIYGPATQYSGWKKVNKKPILSQAHGGLLVTTYLNPIAGNAIQSKTSVFPPGAIIVKETHANDNGKAGAKGMIFAMDKQASGWMWITADATGHVTGSGDSAKMAMCAQCHATAKMDSAFLRSK